MGVLSSFLKLFKFKPGWNGTPEMFLAMVMEMQSRNNKEFSLPEILQWGEVMQKVIKVNLAPYNDFADLIEHGQPDFSMVEKLRGKMDESNHRRNLKQALYKENVERLAQKGNNNECPRPHSLLFNLRSQEFIIKQQIGE